MSWEDKGNQYVIINNGEEARKYENGKEMTDDNSKKQAWNSSYGSNYVISMPFKLTDPGVILTYEGIDSTTLNKRVHSLKVEYEKGAGSSGGMHTWWYYFDEKTYDLAANFLDYGTGHSLTTYETFTKVDGIRFHEKRFSHIADADKNIVQKRTIYENESMKFDEDFDDRYDEAVALVSEAGQASISMVQRRLRVGYNRAARMIETMEKEGIVGPADGAKPREVIVRNNYT